MLHAHWFEVPKPLRLFSIYYQAPDVGRRAGMIRRSFWTHHVDLRREAGELFDSVHKTVRNEIRRGEKEGVLCGASGDPESAVQFFNFIAAKKGLKKISLRRLKKSSWRVTEALHNGRILAVHVYLTPHDSRIARLLYSATADGSEAGPISGFANKALHWWDIQWFKAQGFETYDVGGYALGTKDPRLIGINNFKERLGGNLVGFFHYFGLAAWALFALRELSRRVRR